jgi:hypothetical protein
MILLGLLSGCWLVQQEPSAAGSNPAELLNKGVYGSRTLHDASATWITDRMALEEVYSALNKRQLKNDETLADMDFEAYGVLFLEMGQQQTGGYTIDFVPSLSRVVNGQAVIKILWNTPNEGAYVTQAMTSPFMLLKINLAGITSIRVVDRDEETLFEIPLQ